MPTPVQLGSVLTSTVNVVQKFVVLWIHVRQTHVMKVRSVLQITVVVVIGSVVHHLHLLVHLPPPLQHPRRRQVPRLLLIRSRLGSQRYPPTNRELLRLPQV